MSNVILAIVGSRDMTDQDLFNREIERWIGEYGVPNEIVSGGASGADTMAKEYAKLTGIPIVVFKPDYKTFPSKYAPLARNTQIIGRCTHVLAFPSSMGRGTQDSLRKAESGKKIISVVYIN
jgi:hypothetical protein